MKKINLRDYYPFYTKDTVVEVPEEIALLLREYELLEEAYRIRTYRYKAFYSLDYAGGIERDMAALDQKNPCDLVEQLYDREQLYKALASLPEKQRNRIYAHYFLGMSKSAIARAEGINESNVRQSIEHGLRNLEKILKKIFNSDGEIALKMYGIVRRAFPAGQAGGEAAGRRLWATPRSD